MEPTKHLYCEVAANNGFTCGLFIVCLLCAILLTGCSSSSQREHETSASPLANDIAFTAMQQVGKPYRYGGDSPASGFDCSGLIGYVYQSSAGIPLPRTVNAMQASPYPTVTLSQLHTGDVVVFATGRWRQASHAGIYVGAGRFVHAPSSGGRVRLDNLNDAYWQPRFLNGKRVLSP